MMNVKEVSDWLRTLSPESSIGVDDGGLCLREIDKKGNRTEAYCEIGGLPDDE